MDIVNTEIKKLEQENLREMYKTALVKVKFINEIKSDLGQKIKDSPNKVKIIKKPWYTKMIMAIKELFTKF